MTRALSPPLCSEALRAIGGDLDRRGIKAFLVRREADLYVVEAGYLWPPAPMPLTLHYSLDDIEQLNQEAQENNNRDSAVKDFSTFSQTLWAVGTYLAVKEAHLLNVCNTASTEKMPILKIEYETAMADRIAEEIRGSAIYELCVSLYKLRGTANASNNLRYTRFSALPDNSQDWH